MARNERITIVTTRKFLRDIEIFHVYHSHQYIVFFISVFVQLLKLVLSVAVKINKREWNPDCTVYDEY